MSAPRQVREWVARWWGGEVGAVGEFVSIATWPAERAYSAAVAGRNRAYSRGWLAAEQARIPVVSIGNIAVGGAGKTPFTAWLAGELRAAGRHPAVILRGYGTDEVQVHRELNPHVPVFTAARRSEGAEQAAVAGCDVALLDDGFQHRALHRDLDIVLVSAESWQPNVRLLPRGPWRERTGALARADLLVVTRKSASSERAATVVAELAAFGPPVTCCRISPTHFTPLAAGSVAKIRLDTLRGQSVLAVASLADPAPFADHLRAAGAAVELRAFPDHHSFSEADAADLLRAQGRCIVLTRKEAVKLRPLFPPSAPVLVLEQEVVLEQGGDPVLSAVRAVLREVP